MNTSTSSLKLGLLALAITLPQVAAAQAPADLEIRFYPDRGIYAGELEARRKLSSLVLQTLVVANRSQAPIEITGLELDVMDGELALTTSRLRPADLGRAAAKGAQLRDTGLLELFAFQFKPETTLAGLKLADSPTLGPGQALLVGSRVLTYPGAADRVRVRVEARRADGSTTAATSELKILPAPTEAYDFPLAGTAFIAAGATLHSHHRWGVFEEFALDIVRLGDGTRTHKGDGTRYADFHVYGADVLAVADGEVVGAADTQKEDPAALRQPGETLDAFNQRLGQEQQARMMQGVQVVVGNSVSIKHGDGRVSHYAHLMPGSLVVKVGDRVKRGQKIARVGGSGNSTEPHLHFQVTDGANPVLSAGVPFSFANIEIPHADSPRGLQTGDLVETRP